MVTPSLSYLIHAGRLLAHDVASAEVAEGRELDAFLGAADGHRLTNRAQIAADTLEIGRRHAHNGRILSLGDTKVVRVDVHLLDLKVRDAVVV